MRAPVDNRYRRDTLFSEAAQCGRVATRSPRLAPAIRSDKSKAPLICFQMNGAS